MMLLPLGSPERTLRWCVCFNRNIIEIIGRHLEKYAYFEMAPHDRRTLYLAMIHNDISIKSTGQTFYVGGVERTP